MVEVRGIKRGQIIELLEQINVPDGTEIYMEVELEQPLSEQKKLTKLNQIFGAWQNQPDLDSIFTDIDIERHTYKGREIELFDK